MQDVGGCSDGKGRGSLGSQELELVRRGGTKTGTAGKNVSGRAEA